MPDPDYSALSLEIKALDSVHALLKRDRIGLTVGTIAHEIGVGIGYLQGILKNSTCVLRREGLRWVADWSDLLDWHDWRKRKDFLKTPFERQGNDLVRVSPDETIRVLNVFRDSKPRGNRKVSSNGSHS